jgi:hypothetical protein
MISIGLLKMPSGKSLMASADIFRGKGVTQKSIRKRSGEKKKKK